MNDEAEVQEIEQTEPTGQLGLNENPESTGTQTEPEENFEDWDKQKSVEAYRNLQRKITEKEKAVKAEMEARIRTEERLRLIEEQSQQAKTQQPQIPPKPRPLSPPPQGFNLFEATNEPESTSAKWYQSKLQYDFEKAQYDEYWQGQIETERAKTKQTEEQSRFRNSKVTELQNVGGATLEEAIQIYDWLTSSESIDPKNLVKYFRSTKNTANFKPQVQQQAGFKTPSPVTATSSPQTIVNTKEYTKAKDPTWMLNTK